MPTHPLLGKARKMGNPVIEGETVTFVWQGKTAPRLMDDLHNWEEDPQIMEHAGTGLWSFRMSLAADAYLEYAFLDPKSGERILDPLNQNLIWNGINAYNHFFYMPRGKPTPLVQTKKGVAAGIVTRHQIPTKEYIAGTKRSVYLYQPPVKVPVPLVVVYDGADYLKRASLNIIVDNLIAAKRIRPFAMAMIQNGRAARTLEYACSESTLVFVHDCIIPLAQENLAITPPGEIPYGVLGASLGGLMAMYSGMRMPKIFGKVLSQSGAFIMPEYEFVVVDLVRYAPRAEIEIWMDAGSCEGLLDGNKQMHALLKEKKYKVKYHEYPGGHNYTSWRNDIWRGLEALFR
jgi:enterochelin esterase family protein